VIKKEPENVLKYKDLMIEIQRVWNLKEKEITVIIEATGNISKSQTIPEQHTRKARI
jgi:hypothetical protein